MTGQANGTAAYVVVNLYRVKSFLQIKEIKKMCKVKSKKLDSLYS